MSSPLIVDTSAFISLASIKDSNYQKATSIANRIKEEERTGILPGEVFTEIVNVIGKKIGHQAAIDSANKILLSKSMVIAETTPSIRQNALDKFKLQSKSVSFTDCLVMAFADEYETKVIFGFDETFRKNGYIRIGIDKEEK